MLPTPVMEFERNHLLAQLDDMSDQERFELLDSETRMKLEEEFLETLDRDDLYEIVFGAIDQANGGDADHALATRRWNDFLARTLDRCRGKIETAWLGANR